MKKFYEVPELEKLVLISEAVMSASVDNEDSDNEVDIEDLVGNITTP